MSAFSQTTWTVVCDRGGCSESLSSADLNCAKCSAADLRDELERRGWDVKVHPVSGAVWQDFCPEHKADAEALDA